MGKNTGWNYTFNYNYNFYINIDGTPAEKKKCEQAISDAKSNTWKHLIMNMLMLVLTV